MEQNEKLRALETLQKKLYAYNCASNSLYLDAVTVAPKNTAEGRGVALSILAGELQKLMTAPETLALVEELYARRETLDTLHRREVEELRRRCLALGAELLPSNADLCARFPFLPRYPLWLRLWFGDEEFPASGRLFLDESAAHYLTVEDAVTVGGLLLERLAGGPLLG